MTRESRETLHFRSLIHPAGVLPTSYACPKKTRVLSEPQGHPVKPGPILLMSGKEVTSYQDLIHCWLFPLVNSFYPPSSPLRESAAELPSGPNKFNRDKIIHI